MAPVLLSGQMESIRGLKIRLVGHSKGEQFDIHFSVPGRLYEYRDGRKSCVFTITLNGIYSVEVPELTDEWAKKNSVEATTVKEYKKRDRRKN